MAGIWKGPPGQPSEWDFMQMYQGGYPKSPSAPVQTSQASPLNQAPPAMPPAGGWTSRFNDAEARALGQNPAPGTPPANVPGLPKSKFTNWFTRGFGNMQRPQLPPNYPFGQADYAPPSQGFPFQIPGFFDQMGLGNFYTPHGMGDAQNVPNSGAMANFLGSQWPYAARR